MASTKTPMQRFAVEDDEEPALYEFIERTVEEFDGWLERTGRAADAADVQLLFQWRAYYDDGVLDEWQTGHLDELFLEHLPRKVSAPPEMVRDLPASVGVFFEFWDDVHGLAGNSHEAGRLSAHSAGLTAAFVTAMGNPANFGIAKSFFASVDPDEIDLENPDSIQAAMDRFNSLSFEERGEILGLSDDQPDSQLTVTLVERPPPSPDELAAALGSVPLLVRFDRLHAYLGDGRKLTQTGNLRLADAKALVGLLETDDTIDPVSGGRIFKTRSAADLHDLDLTLHLAESALVLRRTRTALVAADSYEIRDRLDVLAEAFEALMANGFVTAGRSAAVPMADYHEIIDGGVGFVLGVMWDHPDGVGWDVLYEATERVVRGEGLLADFSEQGRRRFIVGDLAMMLRRLELFGLVSWTGWAIEEFTYGSHHRVGGQIALTPVGVAISAPLLEAMGFAFDEDGGLLAFDPADMTFDAADVLLAAGEIASAADPGSGSGHDPIAAVAALLESWGDDSDDAKAAALATAARESGDALLRLDLTVAMRALGAAGAAQMAAELGGPLDAHAQAFLAGVDLLATEETDETDAPGDDAEPPIGLDAMSAILADLIIVSEELEGPEAAYQTFAMATPPEVRLATVERWWRNPGPGIADALDIIGRAAPDKTLAKAARKSAFKARNRS